MSYHQFHSQTTPLQTTIYRFHRTFEWEHPRFTPPIFLPSLPSSIVHIYNFNVLFLAFIKSFNFNTQLLQDFSFDNNEFQLRQCYAPDCTQACFLTQWCHKHLGSIHGVTIWRSIIPNAGAGLFAVRDFEKNVILGIYNGLKIPLDDFNTRAYVRKGNYAIQDNNQVTIAQKSIHGYCRYINDLYHDDQKRILDYNVEFVRGHEGVIVRTKRFIKAGSEIFINYKSTGHV